MPASARADAEAIFRAGVARVDPRSMIARTVSLNGNMLRIIQGDQLLTWDMESFDRLLVLGFGKASARMALGIEDLLGERISDGLIAVKHGHGEKLGRLRLMEAAHPVPDQSSVDAATAILELARQADERTLVILLVSGGGSAILCAPWNEAEYRLSLADKAAVTSALLACGADIREINTVRRHLSAVKGGRLAAALHPATTIALCLSDVLGDELSSIASGPTAPDSSSWADALAIVERYGIKERLPETVKKILQDGASGLVPDTLKPGDPRFERVHNIVIGSNRQAALAAAAEAEKRGYNCLYLGSRITGEAREAARFYLGLAVSCAAGETSLAAPACIIGGGETTVTLRGQGLGGRNQEMALAFALGLGETPEALAGRVCFLSAGTDGNDGPTDAAGGFADLPLLQAAAQAEANPQHSLAENDSYNLLAAAGGLLKTGPTNTNVCDLQICLVR